MAIVTADQGLADRLSSLVKQAGGQRAFARMVGVSAPAVIGWLRGSRPYDSTLRKICAATGVRWEWLVDGTGADPDMHRLAEESPEVWGRAGGISEVRRRKIAELSALLPEAGPSAREELLRRIQELIAEEQRQ